MNVFKDIKNIMRPYDDEEDDLQPFDYDQDEEPVSYQPKQRQEAPKQRPVQPKPYSAPAQSPFKEAAPVRETAPIRETRAPSRTSSAANASSLKVVIVAPTAYEDASQIADNLIDGRTVLLNLEATDRAVARRLLDFLGGVTYARNGNIKRVTANTYIITPDNVDLMSDLVDELENNGLYF